MGAHGGAGGATGGPDLRGAALNRNVAGQPGDNQWRFVKRLVPSAMRFQNAFKGGFKKSSLEQKIDGIDANVETIKTMIDQMKDRSLEPKDSSLLNVQSKLSFCLIN